MKLVLVISTLAKGGAERVLSTLANEWASRGYSVLIITTVKGTVDAYDISPNIGRETLDVCMNSGGLGYYCHMKRIYLLRKIICAYDADCVISFMDISNIFTLLATRGTKIPVVISERINPFVKGESLLWNLLRKWIYPWASVLVLQTKDVKDLFFKKYPHLNCTIIPNPIPNQLLAIKNKTTQNNNFKRKRLVAMGSLRARKGFDLLLQAFNKLHKEQKDWDLWIWGEGQERDKLECYIIDNKLQGRIFLPGVTNTPWEELSKAELFVLSSRLEGMPNVMLEAMALGVATVAFDCRSGPADISDNGKYAELVAPQNVMALTYSLQTLMNDTVRRNKLSKLGEIVKDTYSLKSILNEWDKHLTKLNFNKK